MSNQSSPCVEGQEAAEGKSYYASSSVGTGLEQKHSGDGLNVANPNLEGIAMGYPQELDGLWENTIEKMQFCSMEDDLVPGVLPFSGIIQMPSNNINHIQSIYSMILGMNFHHSGLIHINRVPGVLGARPRGPRKTQGFSTTLNIEFGG